MNLRNSAKGFMIGKGKTIGAIVRIRSEFEHQKFTEFCDEEDIAHKFSAAKTPQQNGVVEW